MKKTTLGLLITAMFAVVMLSCVEEVIVPEYIDRIVEKTVYKDTTTHKAGPPPVFLYADTTSCKVVTCKCDSIPPQVIIEIDSVFITQTIIEHDTVTHFIHHYHDTAYVATMIRQVNSVPDEIKPYFSEFYSQAMDRNAGALGGLTIVQYVLPEDMPGEGWTSHSYWVGGNPYGQMVIELNGDIAPEFLYASTLRELARLQLKRKYNTNPNDIMNPLFPPQTVTINSPEKLFYLDQIFNPFPL